MGAPLEPKRTRVGNNIVRDYKDNYDLSEEERERLYQEELKDPLYRDKNLASKYREHSAMSMSPKGKFALKSALIAAFVTLLIVALIALIPMIPGVTPFFTDTIAPALDTAVKWFDGLDTFQQVALAGGIAIGVGVPVGYGIYKAGCAISRYAKRRGDELDLEQRLYKTAKERDRNRDVDHNNLILEEKAVKEKFTEDSYIKEIKSFRDHTFTKMAREYLYGRKYDEINMRDNVMYNIQPIIDRYKVVDISYINNLFRERVREIEKEVLENRPKYKHDILPVEAINDRANVLESLFTNDYILRRLDIVEPVTYSNISPDRRVHEIDEGYYSDQEYNQTRRYVEPVAYSNIPQNRRVHKKVRWADEGYYSDQEYNPAGGYYTNLASKKDEKGFAQRVFDKREEEVDNQATHSLRG